MQVFSRFTLTILNTGLFEPGRMQYGADRAADGAGEPSLAEMTEKAIKVLGNDEDGFFLVVESKLNLVGIRDDQSQATINRNNFTLANDIQGYSVEVDWLI